MPTRTPIGGVAWILPSSVQAPLSLPTDAARLTQAFRKTAPGLSQINVVRCNELQHAGKSYLGHDVEPIEPILEWNLGPDYPRWTETLHDGTRVLIRPVTKQDAGEERAFIEALSQRSRRFRFLGQVAQPSSRLVALLTDIDYRQDIAFAAILPHGTTETFLGVSRYSASPDGTSCECAVTVLDDWHHKGLGTALMTHLIEVAKARGIRYMFSIDAIANTDMADLAKHLGFVRHVDPDDCTQMIHSLRLEPCLVA